MEYDSNQSRSDQASARARLVITLIWLIVVMSLAGCIDPFTKGKCDKLAKQALRALREGDTEALKQTFCDPIDAARVVDSLRHQLPHGRIRYVRDDYLFPLPTYDRYYGIETDPELDEGIASPLLLRVEFANRDDSICIDTIHAVVESGPAPP